MTKLKAFMDADASLAKRQKGRGEFLLAFFDSICLDISPCLLALALECTLLLWRKVAVKKITVAIVIYVHGPFF